MSQASWLVTFISIVWHNRSMATQIERRIDPSDIPEDEQRRLRELFEGSERPRLIGPDGEEIHLPDAFNNLFVDLLRIMETRQAIVLMPEEEAFTTQAAANFLGMSRPYLLRLLEAGKLPYHRVGTHRRVLFKDLLAFQKARSAERNQGLSQMTKDLVQADLYDRALEPENDNND